MDKRELKKDATIKLSLGFILMAAGFFIPAGTLNWIEAWLYLIIHFSASGIFVIWLLKTGQNKLLKSRLTTKAVKGWDKIILCISVIILIPYLILPGLDAVRYKWSNVSWPVEALGFIALIVSMYILFLVMKENAYLFRVVKVDKDHKLVTTGPYSYVRHPMYVGVIIYAFAVPIALGSLWALIPAAAMNLIIIIRTHLEDKTLQKELKGYKAYSKKVRYKLLPGFW